MSQTCRHGVTTGFCTVPGCQLETPGYSGMTTAQTEPRRLRYVTVEMAHITATQTEPRPATLQGAVGALVEIITACTPLPQKERQKALSAAWAYFGEDA